MKMKAKAKPEGAKMSVPVPGSAIPEEYKDFFATQIQEMADRLCMKFMEKLGDQQKEERKIDQARQKKLEDDLKREREARNKMLAEQKGEKVKELTQVVEELKKKPSTSASTVCLPNPLDLPPTHSNNPWIGGDRISITEDGYANV